ncbi:MAG: hypothetical protein JOZ90_00255 [Alphaproteobacteria bacterium]|nr:hypothetical protein [Alphaproteobacteria bacterium]MBV9370966.1 hypothetical protein [Alphaproteobacteria bacterium]MBV9899509.1 hypothetical protein [Alphaproteobacteria bacterium]
MADSKPFASLSSGLLARKGGAKPAMRPQGFGSFGGSLEDLGWNDMGSHDYGEHVPTPIDALTPSPKGPAPVSPVATVSPVAPVAAAPVPAAPVEPPPVVEQQRVLRDSFAPVEAEVVPIVRRSAAAVAPGAKAKAAFTLRLEPDRHLKLRLACALSRRSAQQLVTAALDDFLATLPEVEALAGRIPAETPQRRRSRR